MAGLDMAVRIDGHPSGEGGTREVYARLLSALGRKVLGISGDHKSGDDSVYWLALAKPLSDKEWAFVLKTLAAAHGKGARADGAAKRNGAGAAAAE